MQGETETVSSCRLGPIRVSCTTPVQFGIGRKWGYFPLADDTAGMQIKNNNRRGIGKKLITITNPFGACAQG